MKTKLRYLKAIIIILALTLGILGIVNLVVGKSTSSSNLILLSSLFFILVVIYGGFRLRSIESASRRLSFAKYGLVVMAILLGVILILDIFFIKPIRLSEFSPFFSTLVLFLMGLSFYFSAKKKQDSAGK